MKAGKLTLLIDFFALAVIIEAECPSCQMNLREEPVPMNDGHNLRRVSRDTQVRKKRRHTCESYRDASAVTGKCQSP